ncbi:hypothetical protein J3F83DRAFT_721247 [Trichoderma novae-zelandiae]
MTPFRSDDHDCTESTTCCAGQRMDDLLALRSNSTQLCLALINHMRRTPGSSPHSACHIGSLPLWFLYINNMCLSVGCRPFLPSLCSIALSVPLLNPPAMHPQPARCLIHLLISYKLGINAANAIDYQQICTGRQKPGPHGQLTHPSPLLTSHSSCNLRCRPIKQDNLTGLCVSPFSFRDALEPYKRRQASKTQSLCGPFVSFGL